MTELVTRKETGLARPARGEEYVTPLTDLYETENGWVLALEMPGVAPENISVEANENVLTVHGRPTLEDHGRPCCQEFVWRDIYRQFTIDDRIDVNRITSELQHGILTIHLPKAEAVKPRKIQVKVV